MVYFQRGRPYSCLAACVFFSVGAAGKDSVSEGLAVEVDTDEDFLCGIEGSGFLASDDSIRL